VRTITKGNWSYTRVGMQKILRAIEPGPAFFRLAEEFEASDLDAEVSGLTKGTVYRRWVFDGYPLVIDEDTTFVGRSFAQEKPHTDGIFDVAVGVRLVLEECTLVNVTVPDVAEIVGGSPGQLISTATGNPERPFTNLLCTCEKCCVVQPVLEAMIEAEDLSCRDEKGRWLHHELKAVYEECRADAELSAAYKELVQAGNKAALAKLAGGG
jgi:hypothetical protein